MTDLRPELQRYLERAWPGADLRALAGDASTRRFIRVCPPRGATRILMDYGQPYDGETDDIRLNRVFRAAGLRVAEIVDSSPSAGCLILEDLGDRSLESALANPPEERRALLEKAVRLAASVGRAGSPVLARSDRSTGPALDGERFRFEMDFFIENYVKRLRGADEPSPALRRALHDLADRAAGTPRRVLCHRDFHSRNLMVLQDGDLAMVDIQDARWGPDSYDLASLLRDAYSEIEETSIDPLVRLHLGQLDDPPPFEIFRERFDIVAAQRMLKALGTFGHQVAVRGRQRYTSAIPRTVERLGRLLPQREQTKLLHDHLVKANLL